MTKEDKKRVSDFCKSYIPAREELNRAKKSRAMLEKKLSTDLTKFERLLIEDTIRVLEAKIEKQMRIMYGFEIKLNGLKGLDKSIIYQLYVEGKAWNEIINEEGVSISTARVGVIRNRALEKLANYIPADDMSQG